MNAMSMGNVASKVTAWLAAYAPAAAARSGKPPHEVGRVLVDDRRVKRLQMALQGAHFVATRRKDG